MAQLDSIDVLKFLFNDNLPSLEGLESLVCVRDLNLFTNPMLEDFDGLNNLEEIDNDGIGDACDNCPMIANAGQEDANNNHIGDPCETPETGKIGVNESSPDAGLHLKNVDVFYDSLLRGIIMTSPSGNCFRLLVNDEGNLYTIPITCPN